MTAEFNWWLLLLGLVVGGGLTWLVLADTRRREQDLEDDELPDEAAWIEARLAESGEPVPVETIERVVQLHRAYLEVPPADDIDVWLDDEPEPVSPAAEQWGRPGPEPDHVAELPPEPAAPDDAAVRHEVRGG